MALSLVLTADSPYSHETRVFQHLVSPQCQCSRTRRPQRVQVGVLAIPLSDTSRRKALLPLFEGLWGCRTTQEPVSLHELQKQPNFMALSSLLLILHSAIGQRMLFGMLLVFVLGPQAWGWRVSTKTRRSRKSGSIWDEQFSQLVSLVEQVADYDFGDSGRDMGRKDAKIDDPVVVAVVFNESRRGRTRRALGLADEDEEEQEVVPEQVVEDGGGEEMVIGGDSSRKVKANKDIVSPHPIDGLWAQH